MNHKIKSKVFKLLNLLPDSAGVSLYHFLQNFSENKNINFKIKSCDETYSMLSSICKKLNIELKNKNLIEIGSGWLPIMPYFFLFKAKCLKIQTYDLNNHYQKKSILKFNELFSSHYNLSITPNKNHFNLPENIFYYPNKNIANEKNIDAEIVFSRFVLEHVTPTDLLEMHQEFKKKLKKGSRIIHFISPSDHRAYSDKSLSLQDFLKYSESEWNQIQTKFDYHNRYRLPQYIDLFKLIGFEIEYLSFDNVKETSDQFIKFSDLKIHSDFKKYTTNELTAGSIIVILKC